MRKRERAVVICLIISVVIYLLPLKGLGAEYSLQELVKIHYDQARSYYRQGEYSKAKAEFQKVLRLQPRHQGAEWYLESVEKELDKYGKTFRGRIEKLFEGRGKERGKEQSIEETLDSFKRHRVETDEAQKEQKDKAEEEKPRLKREAEAKRQEEKLRLKQEAKEETLKHAQAELSKQAKIEAQEEEWIRLKAEKEEKRRLKQETKAKRREEKRLRKEQAREAKEEKLRLKREAKAKRQEEELLKKEQARLRKEQKHLAWERRQELHRHLSRGKIHYFCRRYQRAIEEFNKVLLIDPEYQSVEKYISICQKAIEKQRQKGLQVKEKKEEEKETAYFLRKTSVELMEEEKEKEGLEEIKQLYEKGKECFQRGLYSEALDCFEKVIELGKQP